jgi:flagellar basal-body rod modification protein FlgD
MTMAVSSVSSVAAADVSGVGKSTTTESQSDRFLKLLVAQMKNQDPLNPMDNAQVTSQMAQINTVTGIEKLNGTVQELSGQFMQMQALQGASLVGRDVIVPGKRMDIADGVGQGGYELESAADKVRVEILNGAGKVVDTLDLGAQSNGLHSFDWPAGTRTNADALTFRVTATSGSANKAVTTLMRDQVAAVSTSGAGFKLELVNSGSTDYASVRAFN